MPGGVDLLAEEHKQAGHQRKDRQQAEEDGLDEDGGHIPANAEVHEGQRPQARNRRQRGGADLGDGLGQGRNAGFPGILGLVLVRKPVAEDDGIVDGQRQLKNHRHRIGDKGDFAAQEVGSHIQHRRRAEGQQQHRDFGVGAGGQGQHHHDDDRRNHQDGSHFIGQLRRHILPYFGVNVDILPRQGLPDSLYRRDAHIILGGAVEGHRIEC